MHAMKAEAHGIIAEAGGGKWPGTRLFEEGGGGGSGAVLGTGRLSKNVMDTTTPQKFHGRISGQTWGQFKP